MEKNRSQIPCIWEAQPTGCSKENCPFMHDPYVLKRFLDEHKLELCSSVVPATIVPINMSYEKKRFCFYCKLDTDRLEKLNKSLKKCGSCKLAEYCGKECQRLAFHEGLKFSFVLN